MLNLRYFRQHAIIALFMLMPPAVQAFDQPQCSSCTGVSLDSKSGTGSDSKTAFDGFETNVPPATVRHIFLKEEFWGDNIVHVVTTNYGTEDGYSHLYYIHQYDLTTHAEVANYWTTNNSANFSAVSDHYLILPRFDTNYTTSVGMPRNTFAPPTDFWAYAFIDTTVNDGVCGCSGTWCGTNHTMYSLEYSTTAMENKVSSQVAAALAADPWHSNSPSASGSAGMALDETIASMSHGQYRFRLYTDKDTRYVVTCPVHTYISGPGTNFSNPEPGTISWTLDGTGDEMTSPTYDLVQDFPADGQTISMWVVAGEVCVQAFPIDTGGGGGGAGPGAKCSSCGGNNAPAGSAITPPAISSGPRLNLSLGDNGSGFPIGSMSINPPGPVQATRNLALLQGFGGDLTVVSGGSGLNQWLAPQALFNVVSNSPSQFEIDVYDTNNFSSTFNGTIFPFTANGQFVTWLFENPGGATDTNNLRITEIRGGYGITNLFTWSGGDTFLTLIAGNGLKKEVWAKFWNSDHSVRTETHEIRYTNDTEVYTRLDTFDVFSWGEGLVSSVEGSGGSARTTTYSYTSDGRIQEVDNPDGSWVSYTYDSSGRISRRDWANHYTTYDYTALGGGDDGSFEPNRPRTTMNFLNGSPISGQYSILTATNSIEVQAGDTSGSWTSAANLFTTNNYNTDRRLSSVTRPDKTMQWFDYVIGTASRTNIAYSGYPTGSGSYATNLVETTILGLNGRMMSTTSTEDGILTAQTTYTNYDTLGRVGQITYLDQTFEGYQYDCCGISSMTNRDGMVTDYTYDDLKRTYSRTENGVPGPITWYSNYDPAGHVLSTVRQGTNGTQITLGSATFDVAGHQITSVDALSHTNTYSEALDSYSHWVKTTTYPDGGTRIETQDQDGTLLSLTGTAVRPSSFYYSAVGDGTSYVQETKLDAGGSSTSEWVRKYTDMLGRPCQTVYADAYTTPISISYYNSFGQLTNTVDADLVSTIYAYNTKGEQAYTIVDMNQDHIIDWSGPDRITFTTNDVLTISGTNLHRTRTYVWSTSFNSSNLVSTTQSSTDGLKQWNIAWNNGVGLTNFSQTVYGSSGHRYVTNTAPDASYSVSTYQYGKLMSVVRSDALNNQLSSINCSYDPHGRKNTTTDVRNGTTTYYFNNADQISGSVSPSSDGVLSGQFTTNYFDNMGRIWKTTLPDNTSTTNLFYVTGDLKQSYGSRTYPVGYGYDAQGRMTKMTNWSSFASSSGARATTWNYDAYRGFLSSKTYDGGTLGPAYSYTSAGRILTRLWARGTNTTYSYDNAGSLATVIYNDSTTPGITNGYDRCGRQTIVSNGVAVCTLKYNDQNQVLSESYSGGPLNGLTITNIYDSLLRRTTNGLWNGSAWLTQTRYTYDAASRLFSVSDGTNSGTYSYVANSPLVGQIAFTNAGVLRMTMSKQYDYLNRLTNISSANASSVVLDAYAYAYNSANQRTAVINTDSSSASYWSFGYDFLGQVTSGIKHWPDNSVVAGQQFGYTFDDIGNRITTSSGGDQWGANLRYANYGANNLNQYTNRTVPGAVDVIGTATNTATVSVNDQPTYRKGTYYRAQLPLSNSASAVYQSVTNLAVQNGGTSQDVISNFTGNIFLPQNPESFTYDADGNLTQDGRWTYTWDADNRLIGMTNISGVPSAAQMGLVFSYDYKGRRISKTVTTASSTNSLTFAYDGWNLTAILNPLSSILNSFTWGSDLSGSMQGAGGVGGLISMTVNSGANVGTYFYIYDGNGNVTALVNASIGNIAAQCEYGSFGEVIRATGQMPNVNPFRFSTKYQDDETDLLYFGYRYYSASLGRWLCRDPLAEDGGFDLYSYVDNNPVRGVDPLGLKQYTIWASAFIMPPTMTFVHAYPGGIDLRATWLGNGRSFGPGPLIPTYSKMAHQIVIETDPLLPPLVSNGSVGGFAAVWYTTMFTAGYASGFSPAPALATVTRKSACITVVSINGTVTNPVEPIAPSIRYNYSLEFDVRKGRVTYKGWHTNYPWQELYVNGTSFVSDSPLGPSYTPADLVFTHTIPSRSYRIERECCGGAGGSW